MGTDWIVSNSAFIRPANRELLRTRFGHSSMIALSTNLLQHQGVRSTWPCSRTQSRYAAERIMTPLPFVWPYAVAFWIADVWAFWPEFGIVRRARRSNTATDSKSTQVILLGTSVAYIGAFPLAWLHGFRISAAHQVEVFWFGVALLVSGSLLRRHCWRMLGESFTGDVRVRPDQVVVSRGAYAVLRHPSYTGGILLNTGIGVALGNWASAALLAVASIVVYGYRLVVEERALLAAIGAPYQEFMNTRKRLIPFIY